MANSNGGKRGPDGLTKQQRYVLRNKPTVNAANAKRMRARRVAVKADTMLKKEDSVGVSGTSVPLLDKSTQTEEPEALPATICVAPPLEALSPPEDICHTVQEGEQPTVGLPTDSTVNPTLGYTERVRREIYNSFWFDQQLDGDLAAMDAIDAENKAMDSAVKLYEEYQRLDDNVNALLKFLSSRWSFQEGWHFERAFMGSKSQLWLNSYLARVTDLLNNSKEVLPFLPVGKTSWQETLEIITWASSSSSFMWQFHAALAPDLDNDDSDNDEKDEDEVEL